MWTIARGTARVVHAIVMMVLALFITASAGWARASRPEPTLSVRDGRISASLDRAPLAEALAELGRATGVKITIKSVMSGRSVSARLEGVEIERAIRYLLRDHSYLLVEVEDGAREPRVRLAEVVVLGSGASGAAATETATTRSTPARERPSAAVEPNRAQPRLAEEIAYTALAGATAADRRGALMRLSYEGDTAAAAEALAAALGDPDERVRALALQHLADREDAPPLSLLVRVAREDASADLRRQALDLLVLASPGEARAALRHALSDHDLAIRRHARTLLDGGDAASGGGRGERPSGRQRRSP